MLFSVVVASSYIPINGGRMFFFLHILTLLFLAFLIIANLTGMR